MRRLDLENGLQEAAEFLERVRPWDEVERVNIQRAIAAVREALRQTNRMELSINRFGEEVWKPK